METQDTQKTTVAISLELWRILQSQREPNETVEDVIRKLINKGGTKDGETIA